MKTKRFFKTVSALLSVALLISAFGIVPAAAAKPEVYMFETMNSFTLQNDPANPTNQWTSGVEAVIYKSDNTPFGYAKRGGTFTVDTEINGETVYNSYISSGGSATNQLLQTMFGQVVDSGKLHISYSAMPTDDTNKLRLYVADAEDSSTTNNDGILIDGYDTQRTAHISKNVMIENNAVQVSADSDAASGETKQTLVKDTWYKVDIIYDLDNDNYSAWLNGVELGKNFSFSRDGVKGIFGVWKEADGKRSAWTTSMINNFALDDFYVHSYTENEKVHFATEGVKQLADGSFLLALSPSEYVKDLNYRLTLTNAANNKDITNSDDIVICDEPRSDGQIIITIGAALAGTDIEIGADVAPDDDGAVTTSGATRAETITVTVPGESTNTTTEYYFINDTFDNMPTGKSPIGYEADGTVVTENGTVKLKDGKITKKLANGTPATGSFTLEFDVTRGAGDYRVSAPLYMADTSEITLLAASSQGVSYWADRGEAGTSAEQLTSSADTEHVKLEVDMGKNTYNVSIGDTSEALSPSLKGMLAAGISGISLGGTAEIDNVKLYKNVKSYLYDNFNSHDSSYNVVSSWGGFADENNYVYNPVDFNDTDYLREQCVESFGYTNVAHDRWYFASNGWFDPSVTNGAYLDDSTEKSNTRRYMTQAKVFGITPSAVQSDDASTDVSGHLIQADTESAANYWTAAKAAAGDKVLFVAPRLIRVGAYEESGTAVRNYLQPDQRRVVKYFDRPVSKGTPFTIEYLMSGTTSGYPNSAFGISLIEKGQDASNRNNLLFGYTGTTVSGLTNWNGSDWNLTLFAANTDTSFKDVIENKGEGGVMFSSVTSPSTKTSRAWNANNNHYPTGWEEMCVPAGFIPRTKQLQKVTVTVTPKSDGTTDVTYSLEKADRTNSFTANVQRNFNEKEIIGLAFDTYDATWANGVANTDAEIDPLISANNYWNAETFKVGNLGYMFDELKVYETAASNPVIYIKSIAGLDYANEQSDINDGISDGAKAVAVNFNAGVALSSAQMPGIISLIDADTLNEVETVKELSADKKSVYVIPADGFSANKTYYLAIDNNLEFSPNNASQLAEPALYTFECVGGEQYGVTETGLYDPIIKDGEKTYNELKPAKGKTIQTTAADGTTRLYVDAFSKNGGEPMVAIIGYYVNKNGMKCLVDKQWEPFVAEKGSFRKDFGLKTTNAFDEVCAYVWTSDGAYKPLVNAIGVTVEETAE